MVVKKADIQDLRKIGAVWMECFHMDSPYLELAQRHILPVSDVFCLEKNNEILSVFTLIPIEFHYGDSFLRGAYLAAVATPKKHRGNKYFHKLFTSAAIQDYDFMLVRPADENLLKLYSEEGFSIPVPNPMCDSFDIPENPASSEDLTGTSSAFLRKRLMEQKPSFVWNENVLNFILEESKTNPKTLSQIYFILQEKLPQKISENKPYAFVKLLKDGISPEIFSNSFFLFTLE